MSERRYEVPPYLLGVTGLGALALHRILWRIRMQEEADKGHARSGRAHDSTNNQEK